MGKRSLSWRVFTVILTTLVFTFALAPVAYAFDNFQQDKSVSVTLIKTAAAFFIFVLGARVVYLTRGGFLSIAFILITTGIAIGWVAKLGFEFLTDSLILATTVEVVSLAEALGGIVLAAGFVLLSEKLKG